MKLKKHKAEYPLSADVHFIERVTLVPDHFEDPSLLLYQIHPAEMEARRKENKNDLSGIPVCFSKTDKPSVIFFPAPHKDMQVEICYTELKKI